MTPEMISSMNSTSFDEKAAEPPEDAPPSSGLSQAPTNSNVANQQSVNDPFSISKNRINGDVRLNLGSSALFEKFNGSRSTVTPTVGLGNPGFQSLDSPTGQRLHSDLLSEKEHVAVGAPAPVVREPPLAPMRKVRTLQGLGMDFTMDAPPKMRANSIKSKSRGQMESEDLESIVISGATTTTTGTSDRKRTVSGQPPQPTSTNSMIGVNPPPSEATAPQRRSVRLFNQIRPQSGKFSSSTANLGVKEGREVKKAKATGTKGRSANTFNVGRVVSGNRKHGDAMEIDGKEQKPPNIQNNVPILNPKPAVNEKAKQYEGLQWLLDLFTKLGSGYFALSHYECQSALQIFNSITPSQRDTPWVLAQIGRAFYEQASYAEAEKFFARIKTMAPSRLEDMEVYSTVLWHLKNEIDLAFLSHEIIDVDRTSPEAWCAVGNSFSLQRDHDQALKCFKRATQLNPKFAYAFTLQGHEHVANEEYDKALAAYRSSIAAESRHYNAWYGLGKVFEKQGKYEFAEQHYRTAAGINPTNAVLVCCIGVVLEKMKNPKAALVQYTRSCELAPKSALSRFKKARVLMALQEPHRALAELKVLKDIAPDEANVHFLLGRVYKLLRQKGNAIKHFTTALNLDPKVSHLPGVDENHLTLYAVGVTLYQRGYGANGGRFGGRRWRSACRVSLIEV
jgi:anaphase-promoting complex subunit 3